MKIKIFCRTVAKGKQSFYVAVDGEKYLLFTQDYRVTNREFFQNGVSVSAINNYSNVRSEAVRKTLDKHPTYLHYVENEYNVEIYERSKRLKQIKKQKPYKREPFLWKKQYWDVA